MTTCVTDFITNTINQIIDIFIIVLVLWFLVIATLVIKSQRDSDPKDDVEQEWEAVRYYMGQHVRIIFTKIKNMKTFQRAKNVLVKE